MNKKTKHMKKVVRLNEEKVKNMIKESVIRVLNEMNGEKLPHIIGKFDKSRADEYADIDKLIVKLHPLYMVLNNDSFGYNEKPVNNLTTLSAANAMIRILNDYFEGDYFEIIRGGSDVIVTNNGWFNGEYDMADMWFNYSIGVKEGAPDEVDEDAEEIARSLGYGTLPRAIMHNDTIDRDAEEAERAKNGGLKVLGKIDLSKVDPKGMSKKRW
jgi:hypothetical protein